MSKKSIHVVHILPTLGVGGAERWVVDLVNNSSSQFRYTIIVFFNELTLAKEIFSKHVEVRTVLKTDKFGFGFIRRLQKILQELEPDIVHTHLFAGDFWGRIAARSLAVPIITTEHNINDSEGWLKNFLRFMLRNYSDYYTTCSYRVKEYALERYGLTKPCEVVYAGVDLKRFNNLPWLSPHTPWRLLILGRLVPQKGHEWILRALAGFKNRSWYLEIVGEGELKNYLKKLVINLKIEDQVTFKPATLKVEEVFKDADVVLVPSLWEGLGLVVLEAMAAGRLVVGSRIDGIKEIIKDKETGLFVEKEDPTSLEKVLTYIFKNPDKVQKIAHTAEEYVRDNFGVEKMVRRYEELYQDLAKK